MTEHYTGLTKASRSAATQAGAGAAVLIASGVGASQAIDVAVAGQALGALAGVAILGFSCIRRVGTRATAPVAA